MESKCSLCFCTPFFFFFSFREKQGKQATATVGSNESCMVRKINTNTTVKRLTVFAMI